MNVYVILEGELAAKKLYAAWIPFINAALTHAEGITDVVHNHFYIEAAFGFPGYFDRIRDAIQNVASLEIHGYRQFDRLVVAIDSEDLAHAEKQQEVEAEIEDELDSVTPPIDCRIVIQHFCLETWALGNRRLQVGSKPNATVSKYRAIHNVHALDPELLPALPTEDSNRAQFAYKYLRALLNAKYYNQTYSKSDPKIVAHEAYFDEIRSRFLDTGHIGSLNGLLDAFA